MNTKVWEYGVEDWIYVGNVTLCEFMSENLFDVKFRDI